MSPRSMRQAILVSLANGIAALLLVAASCIGLATPAQATPITSAPIPGLSQGWSGWVPCYYWAHAWSYVSVQKQWSADYKFKRITGIRFKGDDVVAKLDLSVVSSGHTLLKVNNLTVNAKGKTIAEVSGWATTSNGDRQASVSLTRASANFITRYCDATISRW